LVAVELRLDAVGLGVLAEFAAPVGAIVLAVKLEQQFAGLRVERRIGRAVRLEPVGVVRSAASLARHKRPLS
jgi:hypothetical protein